MRRLKLTLTGNGTSSPISVYGFLVNVYLTYSGGHTATTDVTLYEQVDANERALLTVTDNATSGDYPVMAQGKDNTGTAISGTYVYPPVAGELRLRVAGGQAGGTVTAYLWLLDDGVQQGRP